MTFRSRHFRQDCWGRILVLVSMVRKHGRSASSGHFHDVMDVQLCHCNVGCAEGKKRPSKKCDRSYFQSSVGHCHWAVVVGKVLSDDPCLHIADPATMRLSSLMQLVLQLGTAVMWPRYLSLVSGLSPVLDSRKSRYESILVSILDRGEHGSNAPTTTCTSLGRESRSTPYTSNGVQ